MKKSTKKEYRKRRCYVTVTFNEEEILELKELMENGEWKNRAGFIKSQIFGKNHLFEYSRLIGKIETREKLQQQLDEDLKIFNRHLDYSALKRDELEKKIMSSTLKEDTKTKRTISLAINWMKELKQQESNLEYKVEKLLQQFGIIMEKEQADPIRSLPQSIIDQHMANWNDTTSPEFMEGIRRKEEKKEKKHRE